MTPRRSGRVGRARTLALFASLCACSEPAPSTPTPSPPAATTPEPAVPARSLPVLAPLVVPLDATEAERNGAAHLEGGLDYAWDCFAVAATEEDPRVRARARIGMARASYEWARITPPDVARDCPHLEGTARVASARAIALHRARGVVACLRPSAPEPPALDALLAALDAASAELAGVCTEAAALEPVDCAGDLDVPRYGDGLGTLGRCVAPFEGTTGFEGLGLHGTGVGGS